MVYCQKCGAENEDTAKFCKKCGAPLVIEPSKTEVIEKPKAIAGTYPVDITWVFIGTIIAFGIAYILALVFMDVLAGGFIGFLIAGIVIGKQSKGVTIVEAAIAGLLGAFLIIAWAVFSIPVDPARAVMFVIVSFILAGLGGWIGEKWQEYAQKA